MKKKVTYLLVFLALAVACRVWDYYQPNPFLGRGFYTFLSFALVYLIFKIIFEEGSLKKIKEEKTKYTIRKSASILLGFFFFIIFIRIWIKDPQSLLVAYGLIGAGIAVALQDFFKSFVGGIVIFVSGLYRVGDRIDINGKQGDVVDINLLYTTLMEIKEWVEGDQSTGRMSLIPNKEVISFPVNNYTKDNCFIWDEIKIPITYDSDWKLAISKITKIVKAETEATMLEAKKDLAHIKEKYYTGDFKVEPKVFIAMTDNWIQFAVRYVTDVRKRRHVFNDLSQKILEEIQQTPNIRIASETVKILGNGRKKVVKRSSRNK